MSKFANVVPSSPEYWRTTLSICWCDASEWQSSTHWMETGVSKTYVTKVPPGAWSSPESPPAHWVPPASQHPGSVSHTPSSRIGQEVSLAHATP